LVSFFSAQMRDRLVEMWKSRDVCEISKGLWKSFCDFHRPDISISRGPTVPDDERSAVQLDRTGCRRSGARRVAVDLAPPGSTWQRVEPLIARAPSPLWPAAV
jgi:hypothetical protein